MTRTRIRLTYAGEKLTDITHELLRSLRHGDLYTMTSLPETQEVTVSVPSLVGSELVAIGRGLRIECNIEVVERSEAAVAYRAIAEARIAAALGAKAVEIDGTDDVEAFRDKRGYFAVSFADQELMWVFEAAS